MKIVFIGAGDDVLKAATLLIKNGHEVIIIEKKEEKIESLQDELDCGFLQGDGANPNILLETNPKSVDVLFALTDSDNDNIISSLVGKSVGFKRIMVGITDLSYEQVCHELGLENVIVPSQTIGVSLVQFVEKGDAPELNECIKEDAHLFKIYVQKENAGSIKKLELPSDVHPICFYRNEKMQFISEDTKLKKDDEVIVLTKRKSIQNLIDHDEQKS